MTFTAHILSASDEVDMLRDSARNFFAEEWPADKARALSIDVPALLGIWAKMGRQGWLSLGFDADAGGLRFAVVLLQELGRAGCPAPMIDAFLANTVLAGAKRLEGEAAHLIEALHQGHASVSLVLGAQDGDANAGGISLSNESGQTRASGRAAFVEGLSMATHIVALTGQPETIALIGVKDHSVRVIETPGFIAPSLAELEIDNAPAASVPVRPMQPGDLARVARLCLCARSLGAATRGFEMVVDYAKVRTQFGRKIGQFQAIQHKLANVMINVEISKLALWRAAGSYDRGDADWRYAAGAAVSVASPALRQACLETHHAFGGVSFWEEHEMPRHFRRIHADLTRCGGVHAAREDVAHALLDAA